MIRTSDKNFLLISPDGKAVPFDSFLLQKRLEQAMTGYVDPKDLTLAGDIALNVEMALWNKFKNENSETAPGIQTEVLDETIYRILNGAGFKSAAENFRKSATLRDDFTRIALTRIRSFIEENFSLPENVLDRVAEKVSNTLKSIGANDASPGLITELSKHFLSISATATPFPVKQPDFDPDKGCTIPPDEFLTSLNEYTLMLLEKRILKIHPVNLRVFPALRLGIRLTGIADMEQFQPPVTELALAPAFVRIARAADEICLVADRLFRMHGNDSDTSVKVLLHFSDASVFTHDWMGCSSCEAQEKCADMLCRIFAAEMTRFPFKLTCS